jgi:hypothetical protein
MTAQQLHHTLTLLTGTVLYGNDFWAKMNKMRRTQLRI